jgi:thiol-disulfide isomerase/thioredoxin
MVAGVGAPSAPSSFPLSGSPVSGQAASQSTVAQSADAAQAGSDGAGESGGAVLTERQIGAGLGSRATLVQFSSAFCQPCRAARVVLADVAAKSEGVAHVEIDAESHLELVREVGILRTPTTLILDSTGRIAGRAAGVPRRAQVLAALEGFGPQESYVAADAQVTPSSTTGAASVG